MSAPRSLALVGFLALVASCSSSTAPSTGGGGGGGGGGSSCSGSNATPAVCDDHYSPSTSTIAAGSSITWTWHGANQHTVTFMSGSLNGTGSSAMTTGAFTQKFTVAGTYDYQCLVHGSIMSGTVTVTP